MLPHSLLLKPLVVARNRFGSQRAMINSLPKAGTHLLIKALQGVPGLRRAKVDLHNYHLDRFEQPRDASEPSAPIDVDWPRPVSIRSIEAALVRVRCGRFGTGHFGYSDALRMLLHRHRVRVVLMLRDPRDVVLSHARYIAETAHHYLHGTYLALNEDERIRASICGLEPESAEGPRMLDINQRCRAMMAWRGDPAVHVTFFEDLVGASGGGDAGRQVQELQRIASHLGLWLPRKMAGAIAQNLHGGTETFRRGRIAASRERMSAGQRDLFKKVAGDVLIELGYETGYNW